METGVFGRPVAVEVERLRADRGPTDFVRLCGALIGRAMADRLGSFTLPVITERISVPDGGVDAEYTAPEPASPPETGGLVGPGTTVYQFKYRDPSSASRARLVSGLARTLRTESPKVAPRCDRYVLMTNVHLEGAQVRRLRDALVEGDPAFAGKMIVVWGAAEIALALNSIPYLRHLFFAAGGLCTLDFAEQELKVAYDKLGWPGFVNRDGELAAISTFLADGTAKVLQVLGPPYVGKSRLVIEALKPSGASVLWVSQPHDATIDLFRDLDSSEGSGVLIVDRCDGPSAHALPGMARATRRLKTILIGRGPGPSSAPVNSETLHVGGLAETDAFQLVAALAPGIPFMEQSWLASVTRGNPGLVVHVAALVKEARLSGVVSPEDLAARLGDLLERELLVDLPTEARRALEVASLLPVLGLEDEIGTEARAVCLAMDFPHENFLSQIRELEKTGFVQRRGRFIEVVPPLLAEHLVSKALVRPKETLARLRIELERLKHGSDVFLRFLARFRNLPSPSVKSAIAEILGPSGWFPDLEAVLTHVDVLQTLAPAAPAMAIGCIERALAGRSAEELRERVTRNARRALVYTLDDLALRSETYERAAWQLLALAEAENEKFSNNATGVFSSLFHWAHQELSVRLPIRQKVLEEGAGSASPARRRIVAAACGEAFREGTVVALHHADGSFPLEPRYRPATYEEVRPYAGKIMDLLVGLSEDADTEVRGAAIKALLVSLQPFVRLSLLGERFDDLGVRVLGALGKIGQSTQSARTRADIVGRLELTRANLLEGAAKDTPAAEEAIRSVDELLDELTGSGFRDRLWRWIGPQSWGLLKEITASDDSIIQASVRSIASEFLRDPLLFNQHLDWLTSEEARQRFLLFRMLGGGDRGGQLFRLLTERASQAFWAEAFSAYVQGWSESDPKGSEAALDHLAESRPDLAQGIVAATCALPPSGDTVERLLRVVNEASMPRLEIARQVSLLLPWEKLGPEDAERLIRALDDGKPETRSCLLFALRLRISRQAPMTPALRDLAWSFLTSTSPASETVGLRSNWDALAGALGKEEPDRLLRLVEEILSRERGLEDTLIDPRQQLYWVLRTLEERARPGLIRMLLRLAMTPGAPDTVVRILSRVLDPSQDRETLVRFAREVGVEGALVVARYLDADKPGFWEVARDLVAGWGDDGNVWSQLLGRLWSATWSGSAVPMIQGRLEKACALKSDSDPRVASWALEAESNLKSWLEHAQREDREEWIWDYRIPRAGLERMLKDRDSPQRLWAIGRLLEDAPPERVLELLTPREIKEALPKLDHLDERRRQMWDAYSRLGPHAH